MVGGVVEGTICGCLARPIFAKHTLHVLVFAELVPPRHIYHILCQMNVIYFT